MRRMIFLGLCFSIILTGCATKDVKKTSPVPEDSMKVEKLQEEIDTLKKQRDAEAREFESIKKDLEKQLANCGVGLEMQDRGLVIILADNILFDSGKAEIKPEANSVLDGIVKVIETTAVKKNIGIEGHTDNVPIKYSHWKSNRELSTARANIVYHYLKDKGIDPARMTTIGYGEYRPVATNDTEEGRAKNRRVEIVILPEFSRETTPPAKTMASKDEDDTYVK